MAVCLNVRGAHAQKRTLKRWLVIRWFDPNKMKGVSHKANVSVGAQKKEIANVLLAMLQLLFRTKLFI